MRSALQTFNLAAVPRAQIAPLSCRPLCAACSRHFFGGRGSYSSDGGRTWSVHKMDMWKMYDLLPTASGILQSAGGHTVGATEFGWNLSFPEAYQLASGSDKDPVRVTAVAPFATFSGVPYPGVNISNPYVDGPGVLMYGGKRLGNGHYMVTMVLYWNGLQRIQSPPHEGMLP
eukprot:SAG11_NODE_1281_length_5311_cov_4.192441_5_plen_173_part_00